MERLWFSLVVFVAIAFTGCAYPRGTPKVEPKVEPRIEPVELYPGDNVVRITAPAGIRRVEFGVPGKYLDYVELDGAGDVEGCPTEYSIRITVTSATIDLEPAAIVYSCDSSVSMLPLLCSTWRLDVNDFDDARPGDTICRSFQIGLSAYEDHVLDSVSSPDPRVSIRIVDRLPLRIGAGRIFRYDVCFAADEEGEFRFPVITWMQREYPSGGFTNYPVADTGVIRVRSEDLQENADR